MFCKCQFSDFGATVDLVDTADKNLFAAFFESEKFSTEKMCPIDWVALSPCVTRERQRFQYCQQKIRVTID